MWEFLVAFQLGLFSSDLKIHKFVTILLDKKDFIVYQHFFFKFDTQVKIGQKYPKIKN